MRFIFVFLVLQASSMSFASHYCQDVLAGTYDHLSDDDISALENHIGFAAKIDNAITETDAWNFTAEEEKELEEIVNDQSVSINQRVENLYHAIVKIRLANMNSISSFLARRAANDALKQKSIYSKTLGRVLRRLIGPHYNPVFNRTAMKLPRQERTKALESMIALHEVEHAVDRNSNPIFYGFSAIAIAKEILMAVVRTPFTPLIRRRMESRAVSAQWELTSRIPLAQRKELIHNLTRTPKALSMEKEELIKEVADSALLKRLRELYVLFFEAADIEFISRNEPYPFQVIRTFLYGEKGLKKALRLEASNDFLLNQRYHDAFKKLSQKDHDDFKDILKNGLNSETAKKIIRETSFTPAVEDSRFWKKKKIIKELRTEFYTANETEFEQRFKKLLIASLENAHLDKDEFFLVVSRTHGYDLETMFKGHYSLKNPIKAALIVSALYQIVPALMANQPPDTSNILANDIRWIVQFTSYLLGF